MKDKLFTVDKETLELLLYGLSREDCFKALGEVLQELKGERYESFNEPLNKLILKRTRDIEAAKERKSQIYRENADKRWNNDTNNNN